jgi:signal peptidase II|tara:strand:+ start:73 stop:576 length:504 start_codon:yes stop_codon:yes gene_type:complete
LIKKLTVKKLAVPFILILIFLDQVTKWWIINYIMQPIKILPITPFFNIVLTWNSGISFGIFSNQGSFSVIILSTLATLIVFFLAVWLMKAVNKKLIIGLICIIGGAIGNIIDRVYHGAVIDFLDFHIKSYHWPAFNVADSCIFIGATLIILDSLFPDKKEETSIKSI